MHKNHFVCVNDCGKVAAAEHHLWHQITRKHNQSSFRRGLMNTKKNGKSDILRSALFKFS